VRITFKRQEFLEKHRAIFVFGPLVRTRSLITIDCETVFLRVLCWVQWILSTQEKELKESRRKRP